MSDEKPPRRNRVRGSKARRPGSTPHRPTREDLEKRRREIEEKLLALQAFPEPSEDDEPKAVTKRPDMMGNTLWMLRRRIGAVPRTFETPEVMAEAVNSYFQWTKNNPLYELKVTQYLGDPVEFKIPKMRAMSKTRLCLHIGITRAGWDAYQKRKGYEAIWEATMDAIYAQKFEGAAADLLNATIITRDLGLKERTDLTSGDEPISEIVRTIIKNGDSACPT